MSLMYTPPHQCAQACGGRVQVPCNDSPDALGRQPCQEYHSSRRCVRWCAHVWLGVSPKPWHPGFADNTHRSLLRQRVLGAPHASCARSSWACAIGEACPPVLPPGLVRVQQQRPRVWLQGPLPHEATRTTKGRLLATRKGPLMATAPWTKHGHACGSVRCAATKRWARMFRARLRRWARSVMAALRPPSQIGT